MTSDQFYGEITVKTIIQEIFVNLSPFRSRQNVTYVKSDGLKKICFILFVEVESNAVNNHYLLDVDD